MKRHTLTDRADTKTTGNIEPTQEKAGAKRAPDRPDALDELEVFGTWLRGVKAENWILIGLVIGLLVGWEGAATQFPEAIFPSIGETLVALIRMLQDYRNGYLNAVGNTIQNYYAGLGLAIAFGWTLAGLMGLSPLFGRVMTSVLDFLGNIPIIAFMPLFVAMLGLGASAKIVVVLLAAVIVITTTAYAAFERVDHGDEEAAMGLGASKIQAQILVVWPQILPQMIAGLRLGAAQALTACIIAEIYTAMTGLGGLISGYGASFNMPRYFVAVLTTVTIGSATASVLRKLERRFAIP